MLAMVILAMGTMTTAAAIETTAALSPSPALSLSLSSRSRRLRGYSPSLVYGEGEGFRVSACDPLQELQQDHQRKAPQDRPGLISRSYHKKGSHIIEY